MADSQLAAVKALAAQAGSGPAARQSLIAAGAVPKLVKHLSSKTAAIASQSALALSLLASDPSTRPSVWKERRGLVPTIVQALKTGGPLTQERALAALASLIHHVPKAGAAVIKANGIVPILRIAREGSDGPRDAAIAALGAFHSVQVGRTPKPADGYTADALNRCGDLVEPLIRVLSDGPVRARLFALSALRLLPSEDAKVLHALRRPAVTEVLVGFAAAEDADIAATSLEVLASAFGRQENPHEVAPEDAAYQASSTLRKLWETLPCRLQSPVIALVKAAAQYIMRICRAPDLVALPFLRECVHSIPRMLQSPADAVKLQGLYIAHHALRNGFSPEIEELCNGPGLGVMISRLDPRPQMSPEDPSEESSYYPMECCLPDRLVSDLAQSAYAIVVSRGGDSSLPPLDVFISYAEVAEAAGRTLPTLETQPWGFRALLRAGFYKKAAELLEQKLLPRGAVAILGLLFCREESVDPQRLALARQFLSANFLTYLCECIEDGAPQMVETAQIAVDWVTNFVVEYADDPEFPTEDAVPALLTALHGQNLHCPEAYAALWPRIADGITALVTQVDGFETFSNVGGVQWVVDTLTYGPMHAKVGALKILRAAVASGRRDEGGIRLPFSAVEGIVDAALLPPARAASREAMRLLCIITRGCCPGYEICGSEGLRSQRVPASSLEPGGGDVDGSRNGLIPHEGPQIPAELASEVTADVGSAVHADMALEVHANGAPAVPIALPAEVHADVGSAVHADMAPEGHADGASAVPLALPAEVHADVESTVHADMAPEGHADGASAVPIALPAEVHADVESAVHADMAPEVHADWASAVPIALPAKVHADVESAVHAELASEVHDDGASVSIALPAEVHADVESAVHGELAPDAPDQPPRDVPGDIARLGGAKAAIAHLKRLCKPSARGCECESSGLTREAVADFLCWISMAKGALPDLRDNGGLQLLVDLMRGGEGDERQHAQEAVAVLAVSDPAARDPLRAAGAFAPLVAQLEGSSDDDTVLILLAVAALIRGRTRRQLAPGALDDGLAAGAVPALLRILASQSEIAVSAFEPLRLIACDPRGESAILAADYARPLVAALCLSFGLYFPDPNDTETPDTRADVVRMIRKIVEERPEQGEALFAAGLAAELDVIFLSAVVRAKRILAMQLVETLIRHVPGACDALNAEGVLPNLHDLAIAATAPTDPGSAADMNIPEAEEIDPLAYRMQEALSEAEATQARALLCSLAGNFGGVLEMAGLDGEPVRYMAEVDERWSQCGTRRPETPDDVQEGPTPQAARTNRRVCCQCGVVSEKLLQACSRCRRARYCGQDCQKAHWPVHKAQCRR